MFEVKSRSVYIYIKKAGGSVKIHLLIGKYSVEVRHFLLRVTKPYRQLRSDEHRGCQVREYHLQIPILRKGTHRNARQGK